MRRIERGLCATWSVPFLLLVLFLVSIWVLVSSSCMDNRFLSTTKITPSPSKDFLGSPSSVATYEEYNRGALRQLNIRRIDVGLPPIKADLSTGEGLQAALDARQELDKLGERMSFDGQGNQQEAAIQMLQQLLAGGQNSLVQNPSSVSSPLLALLSRGGIPEGAKSGVVAGGGGALDDLLDVGGSSVFNLLSELAKKNAGNADAIQAGDVQKVGIADLIKALQSAQQRPGAGTLGGERDFGAIF